MLKKYLVLLFVGIFSLQLSAQEASKLTLEDIWGSGKFFPRSVSGVNPMNDGNFYCSQVFDPKAKKSVLVKYNFVSGQAVDTIIKASDLVYEGAELDMDAYTFNATENQVLISTESEAIYRRSSREVYYLLDLKTKQVSKLSSGKQSFATFSPDGKMVAFCRDNNIFIKTIGGGEQQVTFDGKINEIINGSSDWVYEEEFEITRTFYWSGDSKKLSYLRFDEKAVPEFVMPMFDALYPTNFTFKYPKAGEKNADLSLFVYDLATAKSTKISETNSKFEYIPRSGWTNNADVLWYIRMNRHQNLMELVSVNTSTKTEKILYKEESKTWIELNDDMVFLKNQNAMLMGSEKDGFRHFYLLDMANGNVKPITKGDWEVTSFYGLDEKSGWLYYQSAEQNSIYRGVYRINIKNGKKENLAIEKGTNRGLFNSTFTHFIHYFSSATTPNVVALRNNSGKLLKTLMDNQGVMDQLTKYGFIAPEFTQIPNGQGTNLNAWIIKPANFDATKKYPVLMYVYGGPGSQQVVDQWSYGNAMWFQYLAQQGYMVACVDNRGTGGRGADFKKTTYLELGKKETEDQIAAAKYFGTLGYVDASRIGIFGWSYGGYMTSLAITKGVDVFKAAIAVAPVINWRYYDSIYTERYMRTPQENAYGYDSNSPSSHATKLKGSYLLIHGTADDNVHFQNAMVMAKELVKANKQFDFMAYPDKNHGISGGATRLQLYTKMSNFLFDNL